MYLHAHTHYVHIAIPAYACSSFETASLIHGVLLVIRPSLNSDRLSNPPHKYEMHHEA